jgi:hypothetical protein
MYICKVKTLHQLGIEPNLNQFQIYSLDYFPTLWEHHNPKESKPLGNQLWNWPWPKSRTKGSYTDSTCQTQNYWSRKFDLAPYLVTIIFYKYFRDPKSKSLPLKKNPRSKPDSSC